MPKNNKPLLPFIKQEVCTFKYQPQYMTTIITCPNCQHEFQPNDAMRDELQKQLRVQMLEWQEKKSEEFKKKEADYQKLLEAKEAETRKFIADEKQKISKNLEEQIRKQLAGDFDVQLKSLQQSNEEQEAKLKLAREKELEFIKKEQDILNKEKELELKMQQMLLDERNKITEQIRKHEEEKNKLKDQEHQMKLKELEKQLEDQRKLAEEMKRKAEQGSMQLQGEVQELALEALLKNAFPFDMVEEVGKGVRGADCIQTVRNNFGQECGKIIFESKRTKDFSADWIEKLKKDARANGADVAVIVTQAMPKDMDGFGEKDGVWICNFSEVKALSSVLRDLIIKVFIATKSQDNKGDKMQMLYTYLTSHEFSEQWKAIREGFMSMKISIQKERDAMEKLWKSREKQLEKVLLNAAHVKGAIEGISGMDEVDLNLLSDEENNLLLEN